jgi:hypothetical protein
MFEIHFQKTTPMRTKVASQQKICHNNQVHQKNILSRQLQLKQMCIDPKALTIADCPPHQLHQQKRTPAAK